MGRCVEIVEAPSCYECMQSWQHFSEHNWCWAGAEASLVSAIALNGQRRFQAILPSVPSAYQYNSSQSTVNDRRSTCFVVRCAQCAPPSTALSHMLPGPGLQSSLAVKRASSNACLGIAGLQQGPAKNRAEPGVEHDSPR